ncbi:RNA-binding region-containing protein 3-like [Asterias amurensis]|uniref:RNA-binding region-containing protein 3-like n=1 Tax=Asterias amurensis TaxID=7602 RepID=UPI003AB7690C
MCFIVKKKEKKKKINMAAPGKEGNFSGRGSPQNTLIIRHLPSSMNSMEKQDFLKYFGAEHAKVLSNYGRMKHTAFASFKDHRSAEQALSRLHQLKVLGHTLVVEYAKNTGSIPEAELAADTEDRCKEGTISRTDEDGMKQSNEGERQSTVLQEEMKGLHQRLMGLSSNHGFDVPLNPTVRYRYPAPTVNILTNIINTLASAPKFYTQVLHLMNKMSLPAPFGPVTPTPPLAEDTVLQPSIDSNRSVMAMDVSSSSDEESEIESDPEEREKTEEVRASLKRPLKTKPLQQPKRHKLQSIAPPKNPQTGPQTSQPAKAVNVFEQPLMAVSKRIEFKITENIGGCVEGQTQAVKDQSLPGIYDPSVADTSESSQQVSGFGTFEHPVTEKDEAPSKKGLYEADDEDEDEDVEEELTEFISRKELRNKLPSDEIKRHPVFKRYERGEPTTRLYLKNLAKTVEEKDLKYIYGRYLDWTSPIDKDMFTIQLMTQGRMKGQAFVGLPSEFAADKALKDTNGYILQGKPIVVQFARSAKLKEKEVPKKKTTRREI